MYDRQAMELAIEAARLEVEELYEPQEAGVVLPDVGLTKRWMFRHAIKDPRRRQTEAGGAGLGNHRRSPHLADTAFEAAVISAKARRGPIELWRLALSP